MSDVDFAAIVRRALLMIVRAIETKYPEVARADPRRPVARRTEFPGRPIADKLDRPHGS